MQHDTVPKVSRSGESIALPSEFVPDFRGQVCREDRLIALPGSLVVLEHQTHTGHGHAGTRAEAGETVPFFDDRERPRAHAMAHKLCSLLRLPS